MEYTMHRLPRSTVLPMLVAVVAALILAVAILQLQPEFGGGVYTVSGKERTFAYPFDSHGDRLEFDIRLPMRLPRLHAQTYVFSADDCILSIVLNGSQLYEGGRGCARDGVRIHLQEYVREGENSLRIRLWNAAGKAALHIRPSAWDPILLSILSVCALAIIWSVHSLARTSLRHRWTAHGPWLAVVTFGILLRLLYVLATPFTVRAHDVMGHTAYIWYILQHAMLPPLHQSWESFQPPLYYALVSVGTLPFLLFGATQTFLIMILKAESWIIASIALAIGGWFGTQLFPKPEERLERVLFPLALAVLPGLAFFASRISNDTLMLLLTTCIIVFSWRYWVKGCQSDWIIACIALGAALLTKASAAAYIPVPFLCLLLRRGLPWGERVRIFAIALFILVVWCGWFYAWRFRVEGQEHIIGNLRGNQEFLFIEDWRPWNFLVFRPHDIIRNPFNNPYNDLFGRKYLWEFLIKSAITGEWQHRTSVAFVTRAIHLMNFPLIILMIAGLAGSLWKSWRKDFPLWCAGACAILSMMGIVASVQNGGLQDFRYVTILALPLTAFLLRGIRMLPKRIQWIPFAFFGLFTGLCVVLILLLSFPSIA